MNPATWRSSGLGRLVVAVALCAAAWSAPRAFTRLADGLGADPLYLAWFVTPTYKINVSTDDSLPNVATGSDPETAIRRSFLTWQEVSTSIVSVADGGTTTIENAGRDGFNLVSFVDDDFVFNGALAATQIFFDAFTGVVTEADIVFNPAVSFSTHGSTSGVHDVQEVATHEIGHFLGLAHSGILSATMYPFAADDSQIERFLDTDDVAGISEVYSHPSFDTEHGKISGVIRFSDGTKLFGTHVVAADLAGRPRVSALTLKDGTYEIPGLSPGSYYLYAEPLDSPVAQANFSGYWSSAPFHDGFRSMFKGGNDNPGTPAVGAGGHIVRRITVSSLAATIDAGLVAKQPAGGGAIAASNTPVTVLQGDADWNIIVAGGGLGPPATFEILGPDVTRTTDFTYGTLGGGAPYIKARFEFDADAIASPRVIRVDSDDETVMLTGGIEILPSPGILYVSKDPLDPSAVFLRWYGGTPPFDLFRDVVPQMDAPVSLYQETDLQFAEGVLLAGMDYYYRLAE
jgi:hypothetical protein